ncbi:MULTISPECIES: hypothetical protein [Elizabethkingia]|uniref:hypothetical protein n=1 Tax=Elizabethkingia TaxID=308865 RepID=UPI000B34B8D8|nr:MULTISPECIES: hypothetical protein [Elizabethkingia]MDC8024897.1 hypothetical protein [Elizabethkingia anophelis]NHQ68117.1 hypothetical protein [Elizabethkingia miricola]NHQ71209.1 hypothetical protein [Elizabethkingia miricola]NHQ76557.1 hypothetical protein [Elizabethkingia miricola]UIO96375.1 hypothetical protein LYZ41_19520 [Elizabethkingia miricola]
MKILEIKGCTECPYFEKGQIEMRKQSLGTAVGWKNKCKLLDKEIYFEEKEETDHLLRNNNHEDCPL